MAISRVLDIISDPETIWLCKSGEDHIVIPFQIEPAEFLSDAEVDLTSDVNHRLINALANSKRAFNCQIDSLLIAFGLFNLAKRKRYHTPQKYQLLGSAGVVTPRILLKLNKMRNLMEHEYIKPNQEQVEDFIDIVLLFLASTNQYIYKFPNSMQLGYDLDSSDFLNIDYDFRASSFSIRIIYGDKSPTEDCKILLDEDNNLYLELLKAWIKFSIK
ncbi:hypothetical protein J2Z48_003053 [Croceifilum oryzae]|uniref:Uncharacterized protein n=1 Tax=Croceifilum oryzae TaxID=1553429 RepID=A0AAJ1TH97_9BACL|nr:hypothetical protein [Croceifilum oryzae]MDQ0418848.1 hypothetical protein [Croceifilum oryzae]